AGVDRHRAGMAEEQRIAVRRGTGDRPRTDKAGAAGTVVHDHLLAERAGELFGHHPGHGVDAATWRIWHHQADRPRRPRLSLRHERGHDAAGGRQQVPVLLHRTPPTMIQGVRLGLRLRRGALPHTPGCEKLERGRYAGAIEKATRSGAKPVAQPITMTQPEYAKARASVDAGASFLPQTREFVLHLQLAALQFGDLEVVDGRMRHRVGNFLLERLMLPFQFRKMRLDGHVGGLLGISPWLHKCAMKAPASRPRSPCATQQISGTAVGKKPRPLAAPGCKRDTSRG